MRWPKAKKYIFLTTLFVLCISGYAYAANSWEYTITEADTVLKIDLSKTSAKIDYENEEITLPKTPSPGIAAFAPDGSYSYAILTYDGVKQYSLDAVTGEMVEIEILNVSATDPLAFALPNPYPDVVLAKANDSGGAEIFSYKFDGAEMLNIPLLNILGLSFISSVSVGEDDGTINALLPELNKAVTFGQDDTGAYSEIEFLAIEGLNNPLAISRGSNFDIAVMEPDRIRWFSLGELGMEEIPAFAVTFPPGSLPKTFVVADGQITVLVDNAVETYLFDGIEMTKVTMLSVTDGLNNPQGLALHPGSFDMIIVEEDKVRYFGFDGDSMVEIESLGIAIENLVMGERYLRTGFVTSLPQGDLNAPFADHVRVLAYTDVPEGTEIVFSVSSNNGENWFKSWRVSREEGENAIIEKTEDDGENWAVLFVGENSAFPSNPGLMLDFWTKIPDVHKGDQVVWKAELKSDDNQVTPKIFIGGSNMAVMWDGNNAPKKPVVNNPVNDDNRRNGIVQEPGWIYTTTPTFVWEFDSFDIDDRQAAFQLRIFRTSDEETDETTVPVFDSGMIISPREVGEVERYTLPTSTTVGVRGPLWVADDYDFKVQVRYWDELCVPSEWSDLHEFKVLAYERPRIMEVVNPIAGQTLPQMLLRTMDIEDLPRVKAGAKVTFEIDSVGPIASPPENIATFFVDGVNDNIYFGARTRVNPSGSANNTWRIEFWTEASLTIVPSGTEVSAELRGAGTVGGVTGYDMPSIFNDTPPGVIVTEGSIHEDWMVVLHGSER